MRKKIDKIFTNIYVKNIIMMILLFTTLYIPELLFRVIYNNKVSLLYWNNASPNLFMFSYITIILGLIYFLPLNKRKIVFNTISIIELFIILAQSIHFEVLGRIFGFSDLSNASEGSKYFLDSLKQFNPKMFYVIIMWVIYMILSNLMIHKVKKVKFKHSNKLIIIMLIIGSLSFRYLANYKLGKLENLDAIILSTNFKYIYNNFEDNTKSYYISGLYEYIFRNIYKSIETKKTFDYKTAYKFIQKYIDENKRELKENEKTNIFKDKNLIYIMLESVDDWLINEEYMPYVYELSKEGMNYTNRYAVQSGSGATLNSEFAMNTGFYSPQNNPAYEYVNNNYSNSLAMIFRNNGYKVNSIHANKGGYYSRSSLHKSFGYEEHYDSEYMDLVAENPRNFFNDLDVVSERRLLDIIIPTGERFMTFFTTYSVHLPYDNNEICNKKFNGNNYTEMQCVKYLASTTDNMIKTLINDLEQKNILDDTVIVLASDHYMYGYENKEELYDLKGTTNTNLLQNVPFIIWSNNIQSETNKTYFGTTDILPTLLNMFGLNYEPNHYLGTDIYSEYHENYVWFMDNNYYNGTYYNETNIGDKKILEDISNKIKFNEYYLKSDYNKYTKKTQK